MKSFLTALLLFPIFFISIKAQYKLDTLMRKQVGPGVVYYNFKEPVAPNIIYMMEIDLKNPYLKMETVKAKDLKVGLEKPSVMARQADSAGHHVIGIVNADFFINSEPDNMQVIRGEITRRQRSGYSAVGFDTSNRFMLAYPAFKGVLFANRKSIALNGVDEARAANQIIMYNSYNGSTTGTQTSGTETVLTPLNGWSVNDTVVCIVKSCKSTYGNTIINKRELVLSGEGTGAAFLNNIKAGDTVKICVEVSTGPRRITELVGGRPIFFKDGEIDSSKASISVIAVRNPRTLIGFSKDSTKAYVMVIDGRQSFSVGMDVWEMTKLMKTLKIHNAMNFDGGGSAIMVIDGATMNSPSDGAERSVSNGLVVVSTAPETNLKSINLAPESLKMFRGDTFNFTVTGKDEFDGLIPLIASKIKYTCSASIGTIASNGAFTAVKSADSGYVYVGYNDLKDSCYVKIQDVKYTIISPKSIVTDSASSVQFAVGAYDQDSVKHTIALNEYSWLSTNTAVGTIDNSGKFKGKAEGNTKVIATYKNISDTAFVKVEIGSGSKLLGDMESLTGWKASGENLDSLSLSLSAEQKSQGSSSFNVYVKYKTASSANMLYLDCDIPVYGVPDSIFMDVKTNGLNNRMYYKFSDDNNEFFKAQAKKYLNSSLAFDRIPAPMKGLSPVDASSVLNYPLILKRIEIQLASVPAGSEYVEGNLYFDNIIVKYPLSTTSVNENTAVPDNFSLYQNYPNPFNPVTTISYSLPKTGYVNLKIFDVLGKEVAQPVNKEMKAGLHKTEFNALNLPSGVYFYRLQFNGAALVNKMMVLK